MSKYIPVLLLFFVGFAHASALPKDDTLPNQPINDPIPNLPTNPGHVPGTITRPHPTNPNTTVRVPYERKSFGRWLGGAGAYVLPTIAIDVLGRGVDWVLDPNNNAIILKPQPGSYTCHGGENLKYTGDPEPMFTKICDDMYPEGYANYTISNQLNNGSGFIRLSCWPRGGTAVILCSPKQEEKIDLDDLADRVADQANKGNPNARRALDDWADQQIRDNPDLANQPEPETSPQPQPQPQPNPNNDPNPQPQPNPNINLDPTKATNPDPDTGLCKTGYEKADDGLCYPTGDELPSTQSDTKTDFPKFCAWAKWLCDIGDAPKHDPLPRATIDETPASDFDRSYVRFDKQCPANVERDISVGITSFTLKYDLAPICDFVRDFVRPLIIFASYFFAALLIARGLRIN